METWLLLLTIAMSILASIPLLHVLSSATSTPLLSFIARILASVIAVIIASSYGVTVSSILQLSGYGGLSQHYTGRCFALVMRLLVGVEFQISDPTNALATRPAVFVGNHQSELDVLMLGTVFPPYCSVTSKASLKYYPFLGWFMLLSKTVFIDRKDAKGAKAVFDSAVKTMKSEGQSVFIFPEGTRSYAREPRMLPFKKGAFHLAVQAGVPVVPVVTENYSATLDMKKMKFERGGIRVHVLSPVKTEGLGPDDVADLSAKVEKIMTEELVRRSGGMSNGDGKAIGVKTAVKT